MSIDKFSDRAENYAKYRPKYAKGFIDYLANEVLERNVSVIADIGAGTGILTRQLTHLAKKIYAVEPSKEMLEECIKDSKNMESLVFIEGTGENTGLDDKSIDIITVSQAFHWLDVEKSRLEFQRILKLDGKVILAWNSRGEEDDFAVEYCNFLKELCPDFKGFAGGIDFIKDNINQFFRGNKLETKVFENDIIINLEAFVGCALSASYAPNENNESYGEFVKGLRKIFEKYNNNGVLVMKNNTYSYLGKF